MLDVLRCVPGISNELDEVYIGDFLLQGWNLESGRTVYPDIRRLPAGHLLRFAKGQIEIRRFMKLPVEEPPRLKRPEEYVERYLTVVRAAVKDRLPESATALHLSGGMDSTTVSAIATEIAANLETRSPLLDLRVLRYELSLLPVPWCANKELCRRAMIGERSGDENAPRVEEVSPREALLDLVKRTYMNAVLDRQRRAEEFDVLGQVVDKVPVRRLIAQKNAEKISALCDLIVADAGKLLRRVAV